MNIGTKKPFLNYSIDISFDFRKTKVEDTISEEFPKYFQLQKLLRSKFIYQNTLIKKKSP